MKIVQTKAHERAAGHGANLVKTYLGKKYTVKTGSDSVFIIDAVAALLHLALLQGHDLAGIVRCAQDHVRKEAIEPDDLCDLADGGIDIIAEDEGTHVTFECRTEKALSELKALDVQQEHWRDKTTVRIEHGTEKWVRLRCKKAGLHVVQRVGVLS